MSVQPSEQHDVDGNALRAGMKIKSELTEKLLGPQGYFTRLFTIIDVHLLVLIIGIQSGLLNFFILKYNSWSFYYYVLFAVDVIGVAAIVWSIMVAKKYFELQDRVENPDCYSNGGIDCNPNHNFAKNFFYCKLPKKFGVLPFIYICWYVNSRRDIEIYFYFPLSLTLFDFLLRLLYSIGLIAKILIIFITDVPNHMLADEFKLGPQALEMIIALTSIVFLVFMQAHRNSENAFHRKLTKTWVEDMISHTVFEIFDSIMFLDLGRFALFEVLLYFLDNESKAIFCGSHSDARTRSPHRRASNQTQRTKHEPLAGIHDHHFGLGEFSDTHHQSVSPFEAECMQGQGVPETGPEGQTTTHLHPLFAVGQRQLCLPGDSYLCESELRQSVDHLHYQERFVHHNVVPKSVHRDTRVLFGEEALGAGRRQEQR